jgi:pyruvate dehydrogenase E1 component alpha subunit/2-oxoisovalerate dehydrogenase E1 component alpha subunit
VAAKKAGGKAKAARKAPARKAGGAKTPPRERSPRPEPSDEEMVRLLDPQGRLLDDAVPLIDDSTVLRAHELMTLLRALDDRMVKLQRQGRVGFYGTCTGEEASVVGLAAAVRDEDWILPALRQGALMLWRGFPLVPYVAQVFGNSGDPTKARQMPSHQADRSRASPTSSRRRSESRRPARSPARARSRSASSATEARRRATSTWPSTWRPS